MIAVKYNVQNPFLCLFSCDTALAAQVATNGRLDVDLRILSISPSLLEIVIPVILANALKYFKIGYNLGQCR